MPTLRLFVALPAPDAVRECLLEAAHRLADAGADVRWEPRDKLHCTLAFLGDVHPERLDEIVGAVRRGVEGIRPFAVAYRGIGFFPDPDRPRIVWGGVDDRTGELARTRASIVRELATAGVTYDEKPFHAHVTLGRIRGPRHLRRLTTIAESCTLDHPPVTVREIVIVRSALKPGGSEYSVLQSVPLTA